VYRAERVVDLPGVALQLRADSARGQPSLIPNLATALVLGLSIALFGLVLALARDVRRRAQAEAALAEALAFRKAMEDSLVTGLRARDLDGAITYVNPAFCAMVGFSPQELRAPVPPYWPPEHVARYQERHRQRLNEGVHDGQAAADGAQRVDSPFLREAREGFETVFMRRTGERFPVMIYETPLVDGQGRHTGWMSAVLDVSAQRRVEEISRQQQDRLQATARLTTVGEMASLLSHELNQPLAAIASYASGSVNLLEAAAADPAELPEAELRPMLRQALGRIAEQAERAGRIIKSVHDFVRRREHQHEVVAVDELLEAVLPLVRLQARKSGTRVEVELPAGAPMPRVRCDRTLLEQVLLNLTRNGIQAMESAATPLEARVLTLRVQQPQAQWVSFHVIDAGPGIPPDVAQRLFQPFFTTRAEGMGLGLSLCRTVIEQHGGSLDFGAAPGCEGAPSGTAFRFTLPTPRSGSAARARPGAAGPTAAASGPEAPQSAAGQSGDTPAPALHPPR
jgi:two-component system sensor histidine kinase DctS